MMHLHMLDKVQCPERSAQKESTNFAIMDKEERSAGRHKFTLE